MSQHPTLHVKCMSEPDKDLLVSYYRSQKMNQKSLATHFGVSERTVNRVLQERGLATPVARIQGEAYRVMKTLKAFGIKPDDLPTILAGWKVYIRGAGLNAHVGAKAALLRPISGAQSPQSKQQQSMPV